MDNELKYSVLVVDDHPVVRHGLRHILEDTDDVLVADEASGAYEALDKIGAKLFDAVLLDIALPDMNGIEVLRTIKRMKPELPVLVLSVYEEEIYAVRAMKEGASGYLTKGRASQELVAAIRKICSGGRYITASLADRLAEAVRDDVNRPLHASLSMREFEVMRLIAQGKSLKLASEVLHLSPKTVTTYRARILDKMRMQSTEEIVQYAIRNHLVD